MSLSLKHYYNFSQWRHQGYTSPGAATDAVTLFYPYKTDDLFSYCLVTTPTLSAFQRSLSIQPQKILFGCHPGDVVTQGGITFNVMLRSISGTGKVDSVIIFDILEHPKIVKSRTLPFIGLALVTVFTWCGAHIEETLFSRSTQCMLFR